MASKSLGFVLLAASGALLFVAFAPRRRQASPARGDFQYATLREPATDGGSDTLARTGAQVAQVAGAVKAGTSLATTAAGGAKAVAGLAGAGAAATPFVATAPGAIAAQIGAPAAAAATGGGGAVAGGGGALAGLGTAAAIAAPLAIVGFGAFRQFESEKAQDKIHEARRAVYNRIAGLPLSDRNGYTGRAFTAPGGTSYLAPRTMNPHGIAGHPNAGQLLVVHPNSGRLGQYDLLEGTFKPAPMPRAVGGTRQVTIKGVPTTQRVEPGVTGAPVMVGIAQRPGTPSYAELRDRWRQVGTMWGRAPANMPTADTWRAIDAAVADFIAQERAQIRLLEQSARGN